MVVEIGLDPYVSEIPPDGYCTFRSLLYAVSNAGKEVKTFRQRLYQHFLTRMGHLHTKSMLGAEWEGSLAYVQSKGKVCKSNKQSTWGSSYEIACFVEWFSVPVWTSVGDNTTWTKYEPLFWSIEEKEISPVIYLKFLNDQHFEPIVNISKDTSMECL
jgi:hypothetical protein